MKNKIQINKVGSFVISARCLEITVLRFEEVEKIARVNSLCFPRRQLENTVQCFEEVRKKPAGFFQWQF